MLSLDIAEYRSVELATSRTKPERDLIHHRSKTRRDPTGELHTISLRPIVVKQMTRAITTGKRATSPCSFSRLFKLTQFLDSDNVLRTGTFLSPLYPLGTDVPTTTIALSIYPHSAVTSPHHPCAALTPPHKPRDRTCKQRHNHPH